MCYLGAKYVRKVDSPEDITLSDFTESIRAQIRGMGIPTFGKPDIDEELLIVPENISELSDEVLDELHLAAQSYSSYISVQCAEADVARKFAEAKKDRMLSRLMLRSERSSADDRKADATSNPAYQRHNMAFLEQYALYTELNSLRNAWEKMAEVYSRHMTRRKTYYEQENGR
jgi:hypothetical protein